MLGTPRSNKEFVADGGNVALLLGWAQEKLWLGMPGTWDGAGSLMRSLQQMHSWGLCPRPGSVFPFPWASKPVKETSKGQD